MKNKFSKEELQAMRLVYLGSVELTDLQMEQIYPVLITQYQALWNSTGITLTCKCGRSYVRRDHYDQHQRQCLMNPDADPSLALRSLNL
jgi:hypothetical protein